MSERPPSFWPLLGLVAAFGVLASLLLDVALGDFRVSAAFLLKQVGEGLALAWAGALGLLGRWGRGKDPFKQAMSAAILPATMIFVVAVSRISLKSDAETTTGAIWSLPTVLSSALVAIAFLGAVSLTWLRIARSRPN